MAKALAGVNPNRCFPYTDQGSMPTHCVHRTGLRMSRGTSVLERIEHTQHRRVPGCRWPNTVRAQLGIGIDFPGIRLGKVRHDKMGILEGSLDGIHDPAINIAIQRRVPPIPEMELQRLLRPLPTTFRSEVVLDMFKPGAVLDKLCGFIPPGAVCDALKADILGLATEFCSRMGISQVKLTMNLLNVQSSPTRGRICPRWHADYVTVRGLCTYMGMGTEFVRNKDADRRLGARVTGADTGGYGLKDGAVPLSAGPGDVLYLKGHAYPGNEGCGAVHRSPEAEVPRLLLVMDEVEEGEDCTCCTPDFELPD
eukprot:jgi/Botrbrau1/11559/Bobra.60_1s0012.1